jgi:hypothetical protein
VLAEQFKAVRWELFGGPVGIGVGIAVGFAVSAVLTYAQDRYCGS